MLTKEQIAAGGSDMEPVQSEEQKAEADRVIKTWDKLDSDAINFKSHWQECYENIVPRKEDVIATRLPGDRRNGDIYDSTAVLANEMLASALHGMLTNPETQFFDIVFGDPALDENDQVKAWCDEVGRRMYHVLNNSNFQTEIYEIYIDLGAAGTACLFMGEHQENVVHFSARALKEIRVRENSLGLIDSVFRTFKYTSQQAISEFGLKNVPLNVKKMAESGSADQIEVVHAVEPMDDLARIGDPKKHTFKSLHVLRNPRFLLSKSGFREFPYAVPRWSKTTGEVYGRGPGMSMLPDIMMVNAMMLTVIQGAQKTVDPPLMVPDDGVIGVVRLQPGGITIVRAGEQNQIKPLITDARIDFGEKMVENVRERIRQGFYVDQMQLKDGPQMTAEEVKQRTEERLRLMGPVLGRQHFELLRPLITRLFAIMERRQMIPSRPSAIAGKKFDVRYSSLIARAQRVSEGQNIARALSLIQPLVQVKPGIADVFNEDKIARKIWTIYGNSQSLLHTQRELDKIRAQQQKAAQDAKAKLDEQHQSEVAKNSAPMMSAVAQARQVQQQGQ